jgi:hypothetical protein
VIVINSPVDFSCIPTQISGENAGGFVYTKFEKMGKKRKKKLLTRRQFFVIFI